jgi:glycosyltransferase involved in cell wall biosynthesis
MMAARQVHVVHVVRTLGRSGGMEKNLARLAVALSSGGMRHSILHLGDEPDQIELPPHILVHRLITPPRDPRMIARIRAKLAELEPTVIHARNWGAWPDTAAARLLVVPVAPLVWSYHGLEARAASRVERVKFRMMARVTTRLFAVSDAAKRMLVESFGLDRDRVGVIENGVDTDRFAPSPEPPSSRARKVIGAVGRVFKIKNMPMLVRAVRRLIADGADVELRIAGEGPELDSVRELARDLGFGDRLALPGYVEDVPSFLRELDLFVLSSDNEANPNALLEAMSARLACISTAVGNVPHLFEGGRSGVLVPPGDEVALAFAISSLLGDEARRRALGEAARRRIVEGYSQARMFERYEALYRDPRGAPLDLSVP